MYWKDYFEAQETFLLTVTKRHRQMRIGMALNLVLSAQLQRHLYYSFDFALLDFLTISQILRIDFTQNAPQQ